MSVATFSTMALFDTADTAAGAMAAARDAGFTDEQISLVMQRDPAAPDPNLELSAHTAGESHFARDTLEGLLLGVAGGAITLALVAGPAGWVGAGWLAAVVFGVGSGGVYGALGGAIIGLGFPTATVDDVKASLDARKVLVTARIDTAAHREQVERIFAECGATLIHKPGG